MNHPVRLIALLLPLLGLAGMASERAAAQEIDPNTPPPIEIVGWKTSGSGCPEGTVFGEATGWSNRHQTITLYFDKYQAEVQAAKAFDVKECHITLFLKAQQGVRTAFNTIAYHGGVSLAKGVTSKLSAFYFWSGFSITPKSISPKEYVGPIEKDFVLQDQVDVQQWSNCATEEEFNIDSFIEVQNPGKAKGWMNVFQSDVKVESEVRPLDARAAVVIEFLTQACASGVRP